MSSPSVSVSQPERARGARTRGARGALIARLLRAPATLANLVADRLLAASWLRLQGVEIGPGCTFSGVPRVRLGPGARLVLGRGVQLASRWSALGMLHPCALSPIGPGAVISIGDESALSGVSIVANVSVAIGRRVLIGNGAAIWDSDFHALSPAARSQRRAARSEPVRIGDDAFIGGRAVVLKGVSVGPGAIVAAGAVVARDVEALAIVAGNPARVVGRVNEKAEKGVTR